MSDEKEQERPDEPVVAPLLFITDLKRSGALASPFNPLGGLMMRASVMGSTDFEGKDLEEMQDLVDNARPEDIESAADALWKAGGKIREVGEDIGKHIDKVKWDGESGDSFRAWGRDLSKNTLLLADYTEQASTHLKAAGVGLASVKSSMPKRDAKIAAAPRLEDIPTPERVDDNEKYRLAKKKEEDRQEAINQMNRLASYYRVSHESMQAKEEPRFGPMPKVGMPPAPPSKGRELLSGGKDSSPSADAYRTAETLPRAEERGGTVRGTSPGDVQGTPVVPGGGIAPGEEVRTELDSVAAPVTPSADSGPRLQTPVNPVTGPPTAGPVGPLPPSSYNGPVNGRGGGGSKVQGSPHPGQQRGTGPGRVTATPPGAPPAGNGTTRSVTGGAPGRTGAVPPAAPPANGAGPRPVAGTGGTPAGRAPQATAPPAGRGGSGIFGGTPSQGGKAATGPRVPRGTVIGTEHGMTGRPPAGSPGAGAIGAGAGGGTTGRRPASTPGGVVGTPRNAPAQGATSRPFTPGGTGLARSGATGGQAPAGAAPRPGTQGSRDEARNESRRPDYLTEDEETWTTGRNGIAPPVVD
jgi:uncharacterized protein YukE